MAVICSQIHYIELFSLNMIKYYQIFLCVFSEEEDNFPSALLSHISLLKALAFFVIKKLSCFLNGLPLFYKAILLVHKWCNKHEQRFSVSYAHCVLQSTFAVSPCQCRWWWRTPAAAVSMAPSPLTTTSTPTPSSSSPVSSATARGMSRAPGPSSSGRTSGT